MAGRPTTHISRARRISSLAVIFVVLSCGVALAWTSQTTNPGNAVTADTLAAPTNVSGATTVSTNTCGTKTVTWTASAAPVNTYIVQAKTANATSWSTLNGDTGPITSITDPTSYTLSDVTYRVAGEYKNGTLTNWSSAYATAATPMTCGPFGEVEDLAATEGCMTGAMTWGAVPGATKYARRYSINGGTTWTTLATQTTTTWNQTFASTDAGNDVQIQVQPQNATYTGNWSNVATIVDLDCAISGPPTPTPNSCHTGVTLAWPAAVTGVVDYDVRASVDGGATWAYNPVVNATTTSATDATGALYPAATTYPAGSDVIYQVRGGPSTTVKGKWTASSAAGLVDNWGFYITSIVFGDGDGNLETNDTATVTFNRAYDITTPSGTGATQLWARSTGTKSIGLGATSNTAAASAIAYITLTNSMATSGALTGSVAPSAGNTVWTWTKSTITTVASTTTPIYGAPAVGTSAGRVKCSDGTSVLMAFASPVTGSF
jgi:hypothetical protein